jgi:hypothetical protein
MTPGQAVILAYAVVAALLWGYAATLFLQARARQEPQGAASGEGPP